LFYQAAWVLSADQPASGTDDVTIGLV